MKPILFLKAQSIPPGSRWITLHPNGADSKGQPVLIQPNADGSAHVIGGAGGKLNYLKLRAVRSESDYKREAAEKKKAATEAKKEQRKRDKENGLVESKKKARENVRTQVRDHERKFVQTVADAMGWDPKSLEFPEQDVAHLSDAAQAKLRLKHHQELLARANEAVDVQRRRLVDDAGARMEAGISEIPLETSDPETLSVQDIAPVKAEGGGLGFSPDYKERAEDAGLTEHELKAEADKAKEAKQASMTPAQRQAAVARGETAKMVADEIKSIREPLVKDTKVQLADAKEAVALLKAQKQLRQLHKKAQEANREIDKSAAEPKAYVIEYTADPEADAKVEADIEGDLRTMKTRAFLSEFQQLAGEAPGESLGKHIGVGAYNSINSLALAVGGEALVDRSVVDVLGVAGAAQVLARRIHSDLADDVDRITEGMQAFHLDHYMATSEQALSDARDLMETAKEIELGELAGGADLQAAQELNARRRRAVTDAQKILGQALGEMEANAALVTALKQGKKDQFEVSLGKVGIEDAIRQVRAIGLQKGDYTIEDVAGDRFLTVNASGLDRLAKPVSRDDVQQVQRNLAIIRGDHDEDGWLPAGVANRPDLAMDVKPGAAPQLAEPFQPGEDLEQSLRDYIGGRAADGDTPGDIVADIQSAEFFQKAGPGRAEEYRAALDAVAPLKGQDGKMQRADALGDTFEKYADAFVQRRYGGARATINQQKFEVDQHAVDALHRALAETPEGTAAYKPIGELQPQDQRAIREFFHRNVAKESPEAAQLRQELEKHAAAEPEAETTDMFGDTVPNPEHGEWRARRDELASQVNASSLTWAKYVETMGGHEKAYEAVQDLIRSKVGRAFVDAHNKLKPGAPLKVGKALIRHNLNHLDATDHEAREARLARDRALTDSLRERVQGRYASGSVSDKLDAARDRQEAFNQAQMGFFADEAPPTATEDIKLEGDERHSIGHAAERQIAGMMGVVGKNFKPGAPTKLWAPTMSGGKNAARQRLVKLVEANKRVVAAFGTGSGKSLLQLASFTHLKEKGQAKRGLFLVPSIVQGQFSGEALRYLEPGKYNWHIQPGSSREERIAAYKNPEHDFAVMTHQSFRDDMLHLGAKHAGIPESEMADRLNAMTDDERKAWMGDLMKREGINFDYLTVDESQNTLNRAGKENSGLANVVDALSHHTPNYLLASGDPVKNDASEVFDLLRKMDPARYGDRAAFMRRYGADTLASKNALKREMARYVYPSKIDPDVQADRREEKIALSAGQKLALSELDKHFSSARIARMQGKVDVVAMRAISPNSFAGAPEDKHEEIARNLQANLGILKASATQRVINTHPDNAKVDHLSKVAAERKGKPGVVFAHSLDAVKAIKERLEKEGHRVVALTGADSSTEKERKRLMFNPEQGDAQADILIASDAGATGMNIQRGQWLVQMDTPQTAMTHAQRQGRIFRTGQKNNVELIDLVADHPEERAARDRLSKKYGLREMMTSSMEGLDDTGVASYLKQQQAQEDDSQTALF
jgi:superfamily II DNA or RNA helicase